MQASSNTAVLRPPDSIALWADESHVQISDTARMQILGERTAQISQLRNVIMAAKVQSTVLRRLVNTPEAAVVWQHLESTFRRGETLLSEIIAFTSPQPARTEPVLVSQWLRDFVQLAAYTLKDNVKLNLDVASSDLIADVDPNQLHQLLMNLVINANDAITGAGTITVCAAEVTNHSREVCFSVRDDGAGMSPEITRRIFDPLFTTKAKGSGLGLSIVARVVAAHGGSLTVESERGSGTVFSVFFPTRA